MSVRALDYDALADPYAAHRRADPAVVGALQAGASLETRTRVLEVGCGTGDHIGALRAATGCVALGVDPSAEMLAVARAREPEIAFELGSAEALSIADGSLDFVFSVDVVHHLSNLAAACTELARILRRGGLTCIVTDDEASIRSRLHARYFPESVGVELERYPTIAELRGALADAGFSGIAEQRTEAVSIVRDASPYAEKAFSSLHLIGDDAHRAGLERLERDLQSRPVEAVSRAVLVWATKP